MIGGLISAGAGLAGSIFGGIKASKAMKNVKNNINEQKEANKDWYNRRYNEDATQRADAQRVLNAVQESILKGNKQAAGAQAVGGGTEESVAATKAANAQSLAEAASQIAVNADARKDQIEQQYRATDASLNSQLNNLEMNKAQQIAESVKAIGGGNGLS
jgi:hypothetical protein